MLQKLRPWKAAPPKLKKSTEPEESPEEAIAQVIGVEPGQIAPLDAPDIRSESPPEMRVQSSVDE